MTDFNDALNAFLASVNEDIKAWYEKDLTNLKFGPEEDADTNGVFAAGGRKYVKVVNKSRSQTMVYCFVAAEDNPKKNVKAGDILKAASWKTPELTRKNPAAGNIFDPSTYENKQKAYGTWLYA